MAIVNGTENPEGLRGTIGNDSIYALGGNDFIYGSDGIDYVDGGEGDDFLLFSFRPNTADILSSPTGPVSYVLSASGLSGSDGVIATSFVGVGNVGFNMAQDFAFDVTFDARQFVPQASTTWSSYVLTGAGNDTVYGSAYGDFINVREGENFVDAGAGYDEVFTYLQDNTDRVYVTGDASAAYVTQGSTTLLTALDTEFIGLNSLTATSDRYIDGSAVVGVSLSMIDGPGNDIYIGSAQDDEFLYGTQGTGPDVYTGNGGADVFDFTYFEASMDQTTITDFHSDDFIDFLNITFYPGGSSSGPTPFNIQGELHFGDFWGYEGELVYNYVDGQTVLQYDADGDRVADETLTIANGMFILEGTRDFDLEGWNSYFGGVRITTANLDRTLTSGNDIFWGGAGDDIVRGLGGDDKLSGLGGNDYLDGGAGSDFASYDDAGAGVVVSLARQGVAQQTKGDGRDTLIGFENLEGSAFADVLKGDGSANRIEGGTGDDALFGDAGDDVLVGEAGNDKLNGQLGNDSMTGGAGDDLYFVDSAGDTVVELSGEGKDEVRLSGTDWTIADNVEVVRVLAGTGTITGNADRNIVFGSTNNNIVKGLGGDDYLDGGKGRDALNGGRGDDVLIGGRGQDWLTGGAGADRFVFTDLLDSAPGKALADIIQDFAQGEDRIVLSKIDAIAGGSDDAFTFVGRSAFSGTAGELRYKFDGGDTIVQMDVDGDGVADMSIRLTGEVELLGSDFIL